MFMRHPAATTIAVMVAAATLLLLVLAARGDAETPDIECLPLPCLEHTVEVDPTDAGDCGLLFVSRCLANASTRPNTYHTRYCCSNGHETHDTQCAASGGQCTLLDKEGGQVCEHGTVLDASCGPNPATCCATRAHCELEACPQGFADEIVPDVSGEAPRACPPDGEHPLSIHCIDTRFGVKVERECCPLPPNPPPPPPPGENRDSPCALAGGHGSCIVDRACHYGVIAAKEGEPPLCDGKPDPNEDCCAAIDFCDMPACPEGTTLSSGLFCAEEDVIHIEGDHCTFLGRRVQQTCCKQSPHPTPPPALPPPVPSPTGGTDHPASNGSNSNTNTTTTTTSSTFPINSTVGTPLLLGGIALAALGLLALGFFLWRRHKRMQEHYDRVGANGELLGSEGEVQLSDFEDEPSGEDE